MASNGTNSEDSGSLPSESAEGADRAALGPAQPTDRVAGSLRDPNAGHGVTGPHTPTGEVTATLAGALEELDIELPDQQVAMLERYCRLLWEWNEKLNLTRHLDYRTFAARDVVDSLAFARALQPGERVLDVGTGGGVPGIVVAITRPDLAVELCESIGKKARAVEDIVHGLGLSAPVHHARAEDLLAAGRSYDTLVIRAVARLDKLLTWFRPYRGRFGRMLVLKGPAWVEERKACRERQLLRDLELRRIDAYATPGTQAQSVLLQLTRKEITSAAPADSRAGPRQAPSKGRRRSKPRPRGGARG